MFFLVEVTSDHPEARNLVLGCAETLARELDTEGRSMFSIEVKDPEGNSIDGWASAN